MNVIKKIKSADPEDVSAEEALKAAMSQMEAEIIRLDPDKSANDEASWQERKSAQTRLAILAAAVECLAKHGYAKTTTQQVAATAKISRGAMLHHYATKSELIASVIEYVFYRRMKLFFGEITRLSEERRRDVTGGVEVYWNWVQTPEFDAFLELSIASRKDAELGEIFETRAIELDAYSFDQIPIFFPEWKAVSKETLRLANDLIVAAIQGLYTNRQIITDRKRRTAVRDLVSKTILMLREGEIDLS